MFCWRKGILAIKEMPFEERHNKLFDFYTFEHTTNYAFHKEQGTLGKYTPQLGGGDALNTIVVETEWDSLAQVQIY
jgi:hypothetical protein